jgi:purine-binding chemotaxis protein CheW
MTKKRIRYSELSAPILDERRSADTPAAPSALVPSRPRAPLDLARAAAESPPGSAVATPVLETPPIVREVAGRLTPIRGTLVIGRPTPGLGSPTIPTRRPPARVDSVLPAGSPSLRDRARSRAGRVELLVFAVGGEWFGVELALIEEAIDLPVVRHIPEMPPAMLGVITVRSALTSVYSPATALGLASAGGGSALIFRRARGWVGIAVDEVDDVHSLDLGHLRDAPGAEANDGILLGVFRHRDTLLALLEADALIAACQTVPVMETA